MNSQTELKVFLAKHPHGPIQNPSQQLEPLLAACWHEFDGDCGGMTGDKLIGRMEEVEWNPPLLRFVIERHGGLVMGSTRADLQHWNINLEDNAIELVHVGVRQIRPMAARVSITGIADEITQQILSGDGSDYLKWEESGVVHVNMAALFSSSSGFKRTVEGRRRRLRDALEERLGEHGWGHIGRNKFAKIRGRRPKKE